jgi:hypothetical protein
VAREFRKGGEFYCGKSLGHSPIQFFITLSILFPTYCPLFSYPEHRPPLACLIRTRIHTDYVQPCCTDAPRPTIRPLYSSASSHSCLTTKFATISRTFIRHTLRLCGRESFCAVSQDRDIGEPRTAPPSLRRINQLTNSQYSFSAPRSIISMR